MSAPSFAPAALEKRVAAYMKTWQMVPPGSVLAVAVSGGLDSVVLLEVLCSLRALQQARLVVATVDHGLRYDAREDLLLVRRLARERGLPCHCGRVSVPNGRGLEDAARAERLAFLEGVPAQRVALGHHLDDQAETVLLRILRGSGLDGMVGMAPTRLPFIRPLLAEPRAALLAYAEARGLTWREDSSNRDRSRERNRLRHEILPALESVHGGSARRLASLGDSLQRDLSLLATLEEAGWQRAECSDGLDRLALLAMAAGLQLSLLRRLVGRWLGTTEGLTANTLDAALALVEHGAPGACLDLPGAWRLAVDTDRVRVLPPLPEAVLLPRQGTFTWGIYRLSLAPEAGTGSPASLRVRPPHAGERWRGQRLVERLRLAGVPASLRVYHPIIEDSVGGSWLPSSPFEGRGSGGPDSAPQHERICVRITPAWFTGCPGSPWCATL